VANSSNIGFEMLNVNRIESDDSNIESNISFREFVPEEIFPRRLGKDIFKSV